MIRLRRIDHVCLRVADVADATRRYALQFGLTVREQSAERATLACDYEPYSLELVRTDDLDEVGYAHCAWELRQAVSLDDRIDHWVRRLLRRGGPGPAAPRTLLNTEAGT